MKQTFVVTRAFASHRVGDVLTLGEQISDREARSKFREGLLRPHRVIERAVQKGERAMSVLSHSPVREAAVWV